MAIDYRLLMDGIIILLLVLTIAYAAALNRRLGRLRGGRAELEAASKGFAEAALRLDSNLKGLKATAEGTGGILQKRIDRASALSQQLGDLIDRSQATVKTNGRKPKFKVSRPRAGGRSAPAKKTAAAMAGTAPLMLDQVADEPPARRVAQRHLEMRDTAESAADADPAGGSDLANLLAALEELR